MLLDVAVVAALFDGRQLPVTRCDPTRHCDILGLCTLDTSESELTLDTGCESSGRDSRC